MTNKSQVWKATNIRSGHGVICQKCQLDCPTAKYMRDKRTKKPTLLDRDPEFESMPHMYACTYMLNDEDIATNHRMWAENDRNFRACAAEYYHIHNEYALATDIKNLLRREGKWHETSDMIKQSVEEEMNEIIPQEEIDEAEQKAKQEKCIAINQPMFDQLLKDIEDSLRSMHNTRALVIHWAKEAGLEIDA